MPEIEQLSEQSPARTRPWEFRPGQSGNSAGRLSVAAKRALIQAKLEELAAEYGGVSALTVIERTLLQEAATLICTKPRRGDDIVRKTNAIQRLLASVRRRRKPPRRSELRDYLRNSR
jgi:hypothetical protein